MDGWVRDDDGETMVYNLFLHRDHHDKYRSADNGVRPRQKRRYEHRRTKRRNSELRDWIFFSPTINCSTRSSPLSGKRWKRQLTITSLGLTGRWRVVLCLRETSRSLSNEYLCSYYVQRYRVYDCFSSSFFFFFENKTLLFFYLVYILYTIFFRGTKAYRKKKKKCEREQSKSVNKRIKFPNNF